MASHFKQNRAVADSGVLLVSILLLIATFLFVAAEYSIVSVRKNKLEAMAKKGSRRARLVLANLQSVGSLVAATQIGITMTGIGIGSVTEPFVTGKLQGLFGDGVSPGIGFAVSYFVITYVLVVLGELVPKYLVIHSPEPLALALVPPVAVLAKLISPLVWLFERSSGVILKVIGITPQAEHGEQVGREELLVMLRSGAHGLEHGDLVSRALKLDALSADDVMIHRMDIQFLDIDTPSEQLLGKIENIPHSRIPVCRGDIDDIVGIVYLHDLIRTRTPAGFSLEKALRPAVIVPENLALDKIIDRMREERTQMLIVVDEYGGTSGLVTLEDVAEEIFGELEDQLEAERPAIERLPSGRISARSETRFDELLDWLEIEMDEPTTDTLAQLLTDALGRVPKVGDGIEIPIGKMRVENMARRRVTRVSIRLGDEFKRE